MTRGSYERQVFINCPFDPGYQAIQDAITFTVFDCGFRPRSALEVDNAAQVRIDKIFEIIGACAFISDIAGQDIRSHQADPQQAIETVRDWLRSVRPLVNIPGGKAVAKRYESFCLDLPAMCQQLNLLRDDLTYVDFTWCVSEWLKINPW